MNILRDYHLSVLGLNLTATENDIKAAYRVLSKKYHPDVNKSPGAQEHFIQIKEAYDYLTGKAKSDEPLFSFDDELTERERWRMEYRSRAKEKETEHQRLQLELIKRILSYLKPVAIGIMVLNALLAMDYFLPLRSHEQRIEGIGPIYEGGYKWGSTPKHRYDGVYFEDFKMRFDRGEVILLDHYDKAVVQATMIFSRPMYAIITIDGVDKRHKQIFNIHHMFGYLIPFMMGFGVLFLKLEKPMHKLNVCIVLLVFFAFQLFIFFT